MMLLARLGSTCPEADQGQRRFSPDGGRDPVLFSVGPIPVKREGEPVKREVTV